MVRDAAFVKKLIALRKKTGLTQREFASRIRISQRTLESWESGRFLPGNPELILAGIKLFLAKHKQ